MDLPNELWEKILFSLNNGASCERLYNALPKKLQNEIMYPYMDHKRSINTRILCAVKNTTALFIENGIYVKFYQKSLFRKRRIHTDAIIRNPTSLF